METLLDIHVWFGWVVIVANGLAGLVALAAWQWPRLRGRWVWGATIGAEVALVIQVVIGTALVARDTYVASNMHMFYGFASFLAIGLAFGYRDSFRGGEGTPSWQRLELFYGLFGLFLMGMTLRAVFEVTA